MTKIEWFFEIAKTIASKSKDRSTKCGCIVVGNDDEIRSVGYNGFVRGANDSIKEWHERPLKYMLTAHAEENAVSAAARIGVSLKNCDAYVTLIPCSTCARMLVQSGIKKINFLVPLENKELECRWREEFRIAIMIMRSGGVDFKGYSGIWGDSIYNLDPMLSKVDAWFEDIEKYK